MRALLLAVLLVPAPAAAGPGATAMDFLRLDAGPRQTAMGGVALGGDAYSMAYNPAWLSRLETSELGLSYSVWLENYKYQDLFYARPWGGESFGVRFQNLDYGKIQGYDDAGAKTTSFGAGDRLLALGWSHSWKGLSLGVSGKWAEERIDDAKATAFLADLGAVWFPFEEGAFQDLSGALSVRNLGSAVKFDSAKEPVPVLLDAGLAMRFFEQALGAGFDVLKPRDGSPYVGAGAEYWLSKQEAALRVGFESRQEGIGLRFGLGLKIGRAQLDYAFVPVGTLGLTHHMGLSFKFGGAAQARFREGVELMRASKPAEALLKFDESLRLDPAHPQAGRWLKRAHKRVNTAVQEAE